MTDEVQAIEDALTGDGLTETVIDVDQLAKENQHLKKKLGDQGNELGTLRRGMDQILQNQLNQQQETLEDDWDFDPIQKEVSGLKNELSSIKQQAALKELETKHPGYGELPNNEAFQGWVNKSQYRSNLYSKADSMDLAAADELFTAWEESQETANNDYQQVRTNRNQALNDATMEKGSAGGMRKTYYSRTALIDMRINNPAKYEAMRDDIMKAYADGRVKK